MEPLPVDVFQLQRRDPLAWTVLLSRSPELADVIVTAVTAEPLWDTSLVTPGRATVERARHMRRYVLTLAGCSDPISFIAKQTNAVEALIYQQLGDPAVRIVGVAEHDRLRVRRQPGPPELHGCVHVEHADEHQDVAGVEPAVLAAVVASVAASSTCFLWASQRAWASAYCCSQAAR